jgi:peptidoglycan/LPS O-acetylase OafA/YrhL
MVRETLRVPGTEVSRTLKPEKRIETIDLLRGLAALAVCWFHLTNANTIAGSGILQASGKYGWLGVEIFFVISGFIIPYALHRGGYRLNRFPTFLLKRITRLDPPYIVSILLVLLTGYLISLAPHYQGEAFHLDIARILLHLGYLNVLVGYEWLNPVYWTLAIEFQYYLLIGLAFPLISSRSWSKRLLFFAALSLLAWKVTFGGFIFHFIFLFFMGISLFQRQSGIISRRELLVLLLLFTAGTYLTLGVPEVLAGMGAVFAISCLTIKNRVFVFLGSISYSLYLVHPPVTRVVYTLGRRFATTAARQTALVFLTLGIIIFSAYLLYLLVEKPAQKWSAHFKYRRSRNAEETGARNSARADADSVAYD